MRCDLLRPHHTNAVERTPAPESQGTSPESPKRQVSKSQVHYPKEGTEYPESE